MNFKTVFNWFYKQGCNYNLFLPEENDYDDNDNEQKDPVMILKHQKYTTRLYVILLMISFYILFYINLMNSQPRTITIDHITPKIFNELYRDYATTLSCPCSTITIPHKDFVSNNIIFHPVCSSYFISDEWIQAVYITNASRYEVTDFRTTASSQFKFLSNLCSMSRDTVNQNEIDFDNNEFVTMNLLREIQLQWEINATLNFLKDRISIQIMSLLNYMRTYSRANYLISALNTNIMIATDATDDLYLVYQLETKYIALNTATASGDSTSASTVLCGTSNPISPAGFFPSYDTKSVFTQALWYKPTVNSTLVKGFYGGCTPLEALLLSTFDCLYDQECLQLLTMYFPNLNQINSNLTDSVLSSKQQNISVIDYLLNLFIEEWSTEMNYSKYFNSCAPLSCSYTTTDLTNLSHAITLFISLYGGLIIILRLISPIVIRILLKCKYRSRNRNIESISPNKYKHKFLHWIKQLNLFKLADKRSADHIKQQRIITRVYLILLTGSFIVLVFFISLSTETVTITVSNPTLETYNNLQESYSTTLRCPCSTTIIPYQSFLTLSPILHQICSSDFVKDEWLSMMKVISDWTNEDWRNRAYTQFRLLSDLCQFANDTTNDAVDHFLSQSFITSSVPSDIYFNTQINTSLNEFIQLTVNSFGSLVDTTHLFTQIDQPYMGSVSVQWMAQLDNNAIANIITNNITNEQSLQIKFILNGPRDVNLTSVKCICAINSHCQSQVAIYEMDHVWDDSHISASIAYIVPGAIAGCSTFTSLLFSDLQCFYSNLSCYPILMNYIRNAYFQNIEFPSWFDAQPLIYDPMLSHYPPNTSISIIVKQMMIERWNVSFSYSRFYELCAPDYCIYSKTIYTHSIIGVMITLISMIGGLIVSLRLITPLLMKFIFRLLIKMNNRKQEQQLVHQNVSSRIRIRIRNLFKFLYENILNLSIFSRRDFRSNIDQVTAKQLGRWATRLYIILFFIGLSILTLYTIIQPQIITKTIDKPSYDLYNHLSQKYEDEMKCSCSLIASTYDKFVLIDAIFHDVCTSPFVSDQWRDKLTVDLAFNLFNYERTDYRRFLSAHLQFLQGLCQLAIQSINDSIDQFLTSLLITTELLSEKEFRIRLDSLIEQRKLAAPTTLARVFFLIETINHGNAIVSTYGTNFEYISSWYWNTDFVPYVPSQAIIYDNECSCGLSRNCTTQANFIRINSTEKIPITGLKMGCTPSESFRASTLECFYNQSCIDLIQQYTDSINRITVNDTPTPLSITKSRFSINTSIAELIDNLFVEQWITTVNYSLYFQQCEPFLCVYTYTQQFNLLYIITLLLGLQGGLTIVLKWICPKLVQIIVKIYKYRTHRLNIVQPSRSREIPTIQISNENPISSSQPLPTTVSVVIKSISGKRHYFKILFTYLMLLFSLTGLILFSVYFAHLEKNKPIKLTTFSTTTNINTITDTTIKTSSTTSTSTMPVPICQAKFRLTTSYRTGSKVGLKSPVTGDFNSDHLLDIVFFNYYTNSMHVLLGNGDGTFRTDIMSLVGSFDGWSFIITTADFNHDNHIDLAFTTENVDFIYIMIGYGNGTLSVLGTIFMGNGSHPRGIVVSHFNNDQHIDIVVANHWNNNLGILLGNGDGTFSSMTTYYTGSNSYPSSVAVADFNRDGYQDIAVNNFMTRNIGIFLGYGNGTFEKQKTSFSGGYYYPSFIATGDFNGDHQFDIVSTYHSGKSIGVLFGYGNGTLSEPMKFIVGNRTSYPRIAVSDFNNDGLADITIGPILRYFICVLTSYGNHNFGIQSVFSTGLSGTYTWVDTGDFNNDGCQDIISSDDNNGALFIVLNTCECRTSATFDRNTSIHL